MTLKLILRDRALRLLPPWLLLGVLIGFLLSSSQQDAVRHGLTVGVHGFQGFRYIAYLPWGLLALYLLYGGVTVRCERFDMTLPISHRALWLSRVLALTLSALALIGTAAATLLLRNWLEGFQVVGRTQVESLFAQLVAASILAVILARLPNPALQETPLSPVYALYLALVWVGTLVVIFLLAGDPPGHALLPGGVALALGLWTYLSLPESPDIVPQEPEAQSPPAVPVTPRETGARETLITTRADSRWLVHTTIWRACYGRWVSWPLFVMLLAIGLGAARSNPDNSLSGPWLFILYWLMLNALFGVAVSRLHMLDPLPVPRKLIFAYVVLPGLLVASLGYLGAMVLRTERESHSPLVLYRQHPVVHDLDVRVPLAFWEIGWNGSPPPVEEPYVPSWEEPHFPWSVSLFEGLTAVLYSPYHVPDGSPPDLVAEQLSRAVEAVYGARIPAGEIQQRYLITKADGSAGVKAGGLTLLEDYPGLKPSAWTRTAPVVILLVGLPWLLYLALTVRGGYASASASRRPWGYFALVGLSALCVLGSLWAYSAGYTEEWKLTAFTQILLRKLSASLPGGTFGQWGIVIALLGGVYVLAQVRFRRIETPSAVGGGTLAG
jgi:hypothetical protein